MRVALVIAPLYGIDMPPLGIAYIAAKLIDDGHEVKVFCFNSQLYHEEKDRQFLWDWNMSNEWCDINKISKYFDLRKLTEKWLGEILKVNPDIVGFSVNSHSRVLSNLLADKLKEKNKDLYVVFGGPWCTELIDKNALNKNVDIYVRGEGEGIISKIARQISDNGSPADLNIAGTILKAGDGFKDNGWDKNPLDINAIPFPALHLFSFDNYTNKEEIPIIFSRGCNYACRFCTDKPMWGNYRMRKAENIIEEKKKHSALFKRKRFKCNDLMVNGDLDGLNKLANLMIQGHLDFTWGSMARARADMTQEMFDDLRKAGCIYLTYGIESGASRVLSHMGKPSKKAISQTLKMTHAAKIKVNTLWMVGYPIEGWLDILETMLFLFRHKRYIDEFVSVSSCYIPQQSWIGKQRKTLNIRYNVDSEWYIGKRNTPYIRELRRKNILKFAKLIGLYKGGIK